MYKKIILLSFAALFLVSQLSLHAIFDHAAGEVAAKVIERTIDKLNETNKSITKDLVAQTNMLNATVLSLRDVVERQTDTELINERSRQAGFNFAYGACQAIGTAAVVGAKASAPFVLGGLVIKTGLSSLAVEFAKDSPSTAFILGGTAVAVSYHVIDTAVTDHKDRNFRRCLNEHFDGKDLNERGFPRRCESPERRLSQWNRERSIATLERFKANKSRAVSQF